MPENDLKIVFSRNLTKLLSKYDKTQKEVAEELGISPTTFNSWCTGDRMPRMDKIQLLSNYFNVLKSELIDDENTSSIVKENTAQYNADASKKYYLNEETEQMAQELFENKELRLLFNAGRNAKAEDLKMVSDMLLRLKKAERHEE